MPLRMVLAGQLRQRWSLSMQAPSSFELHASKKAQTISTQASVCLVMMASRTTVALRLIEPAEQLKAEQDATDPTGVWVPRQHGFMGYGVGSVVREAYGAVQVAAGERVWMR